MIDRKTGMFDEAQLLTRLRNHDKEAFTIIYDSYARKLFRYALKIIKSPEIAEDTVHDVFVKLWNNAPSLYIESSIQAYLYRITHNHLLNLIKRGVMETTIVDEIMFHAEQSSKCTEESVQYKDTLLQSKEAIENLPPQRKLIFELCREQHMSHKQIAAHLGIADSTVNNQMVKAIKSIKNHLMMKGSIGLWLLILSYLTVTV